MGTLESPQVAQLELSKEDCDERIQELWTNYLMTSSRKKKENFLKEIDTWLDTRLFVSRMSQSQSQSQEGGAYD